LGFPKPLPISRKVDEFVKLYSFSLKGREFEFIFSFTQASLINLLAFYKNVMKFVKAPYNKKAGNC